MDIKTVRNLIDRSQNGNLTSPAENDLSYICSCLCDVIEEMKTKIVKLEQKLLTTR